MINPFHTLMSLAQLYSASLQGIHAQPVNVEVHIGAGDFSTVIVGLPDIAIRESRDRVMTAIQTSGFAPPKGRTTINLAPADLRKEGPSFDLPMALGLLGATDQLPSDCLKGVLCIGELALDGSIRPVRGALSIALLATQAGFSKLMLPEANALEAAQVDSLDIWAVKHLRHACEILQGRSLPIEISLLDAPSESGQGLEFQPDLADVKGQKAARRALEIAASGGHHLLMMGPPGTGKSMLARCLPSLLPPMKAREALEATQIHSIAGMLQAHQGRLLNRPFRHPHHSVSDAGLLGGGSYPKPGEISLAHHGVLFLDELPEFRRTALEALRQPLEEGEISIARVQSSITFPAKFMLIAAMNPTPDGPMPEESLSSPRAIERYLGKVSGPLIDRLDMQVEVPVIPYMTLSNETAGESSQRVRERVEKVRQIQAQRFKDHAAVACNAMMGRSALKTFCKLDEAGHQIMAKAYDQLNLSGRSYDRILRLARTIADMDGSALIRASHLMESLQFRGRMGKKMTHT